MPTGIPDDSAMATRVQRARRGVRLRGASVLIAAIVSSSLSAVRSDDAKFPDWPPLLEERFEDKQALDRWEPSDPQAWKLTRQGDNQVASQFQQSEVETPVRSPFNRSVAKDLVVSDFVLDVDLQSTARDYPHRSLCLFFGYQDPAHLYYVHFGQQADEHANQIFIVNGAPRTKISTRTTQGTPWDDKWHRARIVRRVAEGTIEVYFDDLTTPVMTATDTTFGWGQVGIGSFDDTGHFDNVIVRGVRVERPDQPSKPAE
ncbi:MAG: hypothetical protein KF774_00360 [Planctomyces sp.]|nr:hypothetical protein [Planctomyces sp.]